MSNNDADNRTIMQMSDTEGGSRTELFSILKMEKEPCQKLTDYGES